VVILNEPDDPFPTTAVNVVEDNTLNDATEVPPRLTEVAPVRLVPKTVIVDPEPALVGEKELIVGCAKQHTETRSNTNNTKVFLMLAG
jgi:hypothetical protein